MTEAGFFEQRKVSPGGFVAVVALHAAVLGAVVMVKGPQFIPQTFPPTKIIFIPEPAVPPERPKVEPENRQPAQRPTFIDLTPRRIETQPETSSITTGRSDPVLWDPPGPQVIPQPREEPPPLPPVRTEAEFDPRYADSLQPPYPAAEQRAEREGVVRLRVTIGADGRVKAVEKLSATSDAFWQASERHARARWRFRPATLDGRPVESRKVLTLTFRLRDA